MAITRTRRTFNSTKSSSSKSSSIPKSTTKVNASGKDYSSTGNAKADAINLAKANAISAKESAARGEAYDPEAFSADMGENPIVAPGGIEQPEVSPVKTEQPSPQTAKVQAPGQEVPYEQAIANLNAGGGSPELIANATNILKQKYGRGLEADMATGTEAAQDTQAGLSAVSTYAPPTAPDTSQEQLNVESLLQQDKGWQELQTLYDDYEDQTKRKDSFVKEYEKLYKASGIEGIETEMINISNAINGSEADIQLEIQKAGGFGTTSQVMALAAARNKTLLQQYNGLTALAEMKESKLNTMLGLMEKDRQYAEQRFERMVNMKQQEIEYRQKFENNIKENYRNQLQLLGADGMYQAYSQSPNQLAIAERMMGLSSGQLAIAAQRAIDDRAMEIEEHELDLDVKRENILSSRDASARGWKALELEQERMDFDRETARNLGTLNGKPQTSEEAKSEGFGIRSDLSNDVITNLQYDFAKKGAVGGITILGMGAPNQVKSEDRQLYEQAQRDFVNATLRNESGAQIAPDEFDSAAKQYFPQAGDSDAVVEQKERNRNTTINNLYREGNKPRPAKVGQAIFLNGKAYVITGGTADNPDIKEI